MQSTHSQTNIHLQDLSGCIFPSFITHSLKNSKKWDIAAVSFQQREDDLLFYTLWHKPLLFMWGDYWSKNRWSQLSGSYSLQGFNWLNLYVNIMKVCVCVCDLMFYLILKGFHLHRSLFATSASTYMLNCSHTQAVVKQSLGDSIK